MTEVTYFYIYTKEKSSKTRRNNCINSPLFAVPRKLGKVKFYTSFNTFAWKHNKNRKEENPVVSV